ncbi:LacI family transcriptional regulator [Sphingorhabdus lutea]|uniref:LacI family transcriptional regulator n=2 Tax=Sphingorhabdus lutea TaxID=1913578 RepID=A0A1L3JEP2_9SPHN|nr:LacI family DNA-binding transcriptional regulator [Sphingorhabdus lutea]APG63611.1 LacI family transcriptional regulator [Sphingorhabdus lutea]
MNIKSSRGQKNGATIADVAKESGFSPMTVSRVINGESHVKDATREAVMAAVKKLDYSPNLAARSLAGAEQVRVGLLYSNPSAAYLSRFLVGCLEQARENHIQLIIEDCGSELAAIDAIKKLKASNVDGIIMSPPLCDSKNVLRAIEEVGMLAVVIANWRPPSAVSVIRIDDIGAARAMTNHIISLGHRDIGFIIGNPTHMASHERLVGFQEALKENNINLPEEYIEQGSFTYRSGLKAAEKLLSLPKPPTAIFASNDDMAAAAVTVAHRRHMDVPKDITICGFDDTDFAQSIWPELTTIHQPIAKMSREAVNMLVEQIRNKRSNKEIGSLDLLLDYTFVKRESDAAAP